MNMKPCRLKTICLSFIMLFLAASVGQAAEDVSKPLILPQGTANSAHTPDLILPKVLPPNPGDRRSLPDSDQPPPLSGRSNDPNLTVKTEDSPKDFQKDPTKPGAQEPLPGRQLPPSDQKTFNAQPKIIQFKGSGPESREDFSRRFWSGPHVNQPAEGGAPSRDRPSDGRKGLSGTWRKGPLKANPKAGAELVTDATDSDSPSAAKTEPVAVREKEPAPVRE
jgi:hypothetical protein